MLQCVAMAAALTLQPASIPDLARTVGAQAHALAGRPEDGLFATDLGAFATEAAALGAALQRAGVRGDLPCVFAGIGEDAAASAENLRLAGPQAQHDAVLAEIRAMLIDAANLAPQVSGAPRDPGLSLAGGLLGD